MDLDARDAGSREKVSASVDSEWTVCACGLQLYSRSVCVCKC
jgi:hypothetical protein